METDTQGLPPIEYIEPALDVSRPQRYLRNHGFGLRHGNLTDTTVFASIRRVHKLLTGRLAKRDVPPPGLDQGRIDRPRNLEDDRLDGGSAIPEVSGHGEPG